MMLPRCQSAHSRTNFGAGRLVSLNSFDASSNVLRLPEFPYYTHRPCHSLSVIFFGYVSHYKSRSDDFYRHPDKHRLQREVIQIYVAQARIWENVLTYIPRHASAFLFFFVVVFLKVEISSRTPVPLFRPESVHSGLAS